MARTQTEIPTNADDYIDSRDVIAALVDFADDEDAADEYAELAAFAVDGPYYAEDWEYGALFIRDSYFREYAQEFAEEVGAIDDNARWPCTCIDWEQAARELQMDFTAVDFGGVTYWVR